ncbi:hypothetical protein KIW84_075212 [Lathyrus oleraceus]|uniref:HAT C-terminal dimerisation domain-containing protein n=1 Tax=Pisum sativum TaxID=3888 RepID=A0A9D4VT51_PEA|nr:hypothetical protein KIW84_075212 [Pisum sativum]
MFVKSVDASDYANTGDKPTELLGTFVKEIGYYLNPEYYYEKPEIENDPKLVRGLRKCIETLSESDEVEDKISIQLAQYKGATDLFSIRAPIRQRSTLASVEWWKSYGAETPDLQFLVVKVLSLGCSAS